jgi:hypothetical protein
MRNRIRLAVFVCQALLVAAVATGGATAAHPEGGGPAVVLELFTSQGCSSCPPADRLLSRLGRDERLRGRVVTLAFHVDYFNSLGWTDRFSSADWTARQDAYARALKRDGVYTPQLVVNGRAELNGSDEAGVVREVNTAWANAPSGRVTLAVAPDGERRLAVDVSAETPEAVDAGKLDVVVVVYENGVSTPVKRGENSGRTLEEDFVVRRLARAFSFKPEAGAKQQKRVTIDLDRSWVPANLGVAAILQDPDTMRIYGATAR